MVNELFFIVYLTKNKSYRNQTAKRIFLVFGLISFSLIIKICATILKKEVTHIYQ